MTALKQRGRLTGVYGDEETGVPQLRDWGRLGHPASTPFPLCPLQLIGRVSVAEPGLEEQGLTSPPAVETCPNLESLQLLEASPASSPSTSMDLPEPRGTAEHTNNRIGESACLGGPGVLRGRRDGP